MEGQSIGSAYSLRTFGSLSLSTLPHTLTRVFLSKLRSVLGSFKFSPQADPPQTQQRTTMSLVSNNDGHASCTSEIGVVTAATQHAVETMNDFRGSVPTQLVNGLAKAFQSVGNETRGTSKGGHFHTASAYIRFKDQLACKMECVMTYANLEEPQLAVQLLYTRVDSG